MKSIILVSNAFFPEISPRSFRATELAKEFCRQGHNVTVISKYREYDYTDFLSSYPIEFSMWKKDRFPKVLIVKRKPFSFIAKGLNRVLGLLFEYPAIEDMFKVKRILKTERGYDLLISFAVPYPVHWGVAKAWRESSPIAKTWIADCGDPYMGDVLDSFRKPPYFSILERQFCRKADYITIPIESARGAYYKEFQNKIRIISQGFDFDISDNMDSHIQNDIPQFAYAGGFLKGIRDPEKLLKFLIEIGMPFKFFVYTNQPELLVNYLEVLKGKLIISEFIDRDSLITILKKMDFLINFDNNTTINVPSKLIDYAIVNRPVLNVDKNFNIEILKDFLKGNFEKKLLLPKPEKYHISNISKLFLELE